MRARFGILVSAAVLVGALSGCPNEVADPCGGEPTCAGKADTPPRIYVDPPFGVGFTCVTIGCDDVRRMRVENRGGGVLKLSLVRLAVDASTDFELERAAGPDAGVADEPLPTPDDQLELGEGEALDLLVRYAPSDGLTDEGAVWVDWYDGAIAYEDAVVERIELPLSSRVLGNAAATAADDRLDFGYVPVDELAVLPFRVHNDGDAVLQVGPAALEPGSSSAFVMPTNTTWGTQFVNPGEAAEILVGYRPGAPEASFGLLVVDTNDPARSRIPVSLLGTAIADPRLEVVNVDSGLVEFGEVRVQTERTREIIVRNLGGQPLEVTPRLVAGGTLGYSLETQSGGSRVTVHPLGEARITVKLRPTVGGPLAGRLILVSNDPMKPESAVELSAQGAAPDAVVTPSSLDFGTLVQSWISPAQSVSIRNGGTGELTISGISFEVGSSSQIQLASVPALPIKLHPTDPPLEVSIYVTATTLGPADAVLLVQTDSVGEGTKRVPITARIVSCEEGCPTANGTPDCSAGRCDIASCLPSFHDADQSASSGCECQEDRVVNTNADISGNCPGLNVGPLGDGCTDYPREVIRSGTLHSPTDVDLYFFFSDDGGSAFCDTFGDSYRLTVELLSAPPGVELCFRTVGAGNGCGGENQRQCGQTRYQVDGSYGSDDDRDTTVWVQFAPGAAPVCGEYQIKFRSRD